MKLATAILDVLRIIGMSNSDAIRANLINFLDFLRGFKDFTDENFQIKQIQTLLCYMSLETIRTQNDYRVFEIVGYL